MKFKLYTLVDITETGSRKGDDPRSIHQQQNFLTILQTIGLRVNPSYDISPKCFTGIPKEYNLCTAIKGDHAIWEFSFDIEFEGALTLDMLTSDFDLIPFIDSLDNTATFKNAHFSTKAAQSNIQFMIDDK